MTYSPLYTIQLNHGYYQNGKSNDFSLIPTKDCMKIIKGYGLLWRPRVSSWQMITKLSNQILIQNIPSKTLFQFYLVVRDCSILNVTSFGTIDIGEVLNGSCYLNFSDSGEKILRLSKAYHFRTDSFEVVTPNQHDVYFLQGVPIDGLDVSSFEIEGLGTNAIVDHYEEDNKKVIINTESTNPNTKFTLTYKTTSNWAKGVIGLLEVSLDDYSVLDHQLQLNVDSRSAHWKYYVATDNALDKLELKEESSTYHFDKEDLRKQLTPNKLESWLLEKFKSTPSLAVFTSNNSIAFGDHLEANLQLLNSQKILQSNLVIPSRNNTPFQIITQFSST